jgi:hypothetical protein
VKEGYEFYLGKQDGGSYMIPANSLEKVPVKLTPDNAFVVQVALKNMYKLVCGRRTSRMSRFIGYADT